MLCSRRYAGGFLHHGMLGDTALYIKEECKSYNKKGEVCSKRYTYTDSQTHVISRIHIQKRKNKDELFEMNYDDWRNAGSPKDDLLIGKRFVVKADISTFFPSFIRIQFRGHWWEKQSRNRIEANPSGLIKLTKSVKR